MWRAAILWVGALGAILFVLVGRFWVMPGQEVAVYLPARSAVAYVQVWANSMMEGRYEVLVATQHGRLRRILWEDWGPAQRASLYLTPEGWLAILGGGGDATIIAIPENARPFEVPRTELQNVRSETWHYVGAVDRANRRLRFFSPDDQSECFPMFGEGNSPYRKAHQVEGSC